MDNDLRPKNDPLTFSQDVNYKESDLWFDAMKGEMISMESNGFWDLVGLPDGEKTIGCKWVYKKRKTH